MAESNTELGIATYPIKYNEILAVGAGIGGGFVHTSELQPMKYNEAMRKDPIEWSKAVDEEHKRMIRHTVWRPVSKIFLSMPRS